MTDGRIRVVFSLDSLGVGGTEMNALRVAERLDRAEFDLSVACFRGDGRLRPRFDAAGVRVDEFPLRSLYRASAVKQGLRFLQFLRRERVDVVHAHDRYANIFAVPWARLAGTPAVIASKRWGSIGRAHGIGNRMAYRLADRVLANSGGVGDSLVADDGVPRSRVVVIPNFVDDEAFAEPSSDWLRDMRSTLRVPDGALVVGIVANLRTIKNHRLLLDAMARLRTRFPNAILVMAGDGPDRKAVEVHVAELHIGEMVRFAGLLPNLPNPHRLFHVSVLSSLSEGFPNSIVEAMAAARPVVATAVGGVRDAVEHGVTGLLVESGDTSALTGALAQLLESAELRAALGSAGQQRARERFTSEGVVPSVAELYRELVDGAGARRGLARRVRSLPERSVR
ncbi:MAG: glycosyltransferase [bacterium]